MIATTAAAAAVVVVVVGGVQIGCRTTRTLARGERSSYILTWLYRAHLYFK
jgi:hypothetical protein